MKKDLEKRWKAIYSAVLTAHGDRLWWLKVRLYPLRASLDNEGERCSMCKASWSNVNGAINHVAGFPHFRQWCREHPAEAAAKWCPDILVLVAEETLAGVEMGAPA